MGSYLIFVHLDLYKATVLDTEPEFSRMVMCGSMLNNFDVYSEAEYNHEVYCLVGCDTM
jgi:hypothetical protein